MLVVEENVIVLLNRRGRQVYFSENLIGVASIVSTADVCRR